MPKTNIQTLNHTGHRIKELRKERKMSQTDLAQRVGCAQATIAEWERREDRVPSSKLLKKIAEVLDVPINYFFLQNKIDVSEIPYYGEIAGESFTWPDDLVNWPENNNNKEMNSCFSLRIIDDFMKPVIEEGDYGIFKRQPPQDRDIVIVRFHQDNKTVVRIWRQQEQYAMLSEINLKRIGLPCFFELISDINDDLTYNVKTNLLQQKITIEGKLIAVKKGIKPSETYLGIEYIFS